MQGWYRAPRGNYFEEGHLKEWWLAANVRSKPELDPESG